MQELQFYTLFILLTRCRIITGERYFETVFSSPSNPSCDIQVYRGRYPIVPYCTGGAEAGTKGDAISIAEFRNEDNHFELEKSP